MRRKEIVFFTNIATPYRTEFYNHLFSRDIDGEVWYMQGAVKYRSWKIENFDITHPHFINNGLYLQLGSFPLFFNPRLVFKALVERPENIVLGLSWNDPDAVLLVLFKKLGLLRSRLHFWSEANFLTSGARRDNRAKKWFRRFIYNNIDGAQMRSGQMTEETFRKWNVDVRQYIELPNTIQEDIFGQPKMASTIAKQTSSFPTILIVARLNESLKGIEHFLTSLTDEQIRSVRIVIAGEGPDRDTYATYIENRGLGEHVRLIGEQSPEQLKDAYAQADIFCLPSFSDPCPLSINEAMCCGLPLFVSRRCGNAIEAVEDGVNGFSFDPEDHDDMSSKFDMLLSSNSSLVKMGFMSNKKYLQMFGRDKVIDRFLVEFSHNYPFKS